MKLKAPAAEIRPHAEVKTPVIPKKEVGLKELDLAKSIDYVPPESADAALKAIAKKEPFKPGIYSNSISGVAARIGNLTSVLENRNLPDEKRARIEAELTTLKAELKTLAGEVEEVSQAKKKEEVSLQDNEKSYLEANKEKFEGLEGRYHDKSTKAEYVRKQIEDFAALSGVKHETPVAIKGKSFDAETRAIVGEAVQKQIDTLLNSEKGRLNRAKHESVSKETSRYLDLTLEAVKQGDLREADANTVLKLVERNVWSLAYQDRIASENLLGDHGIRHLLDHNIPVTEKIFDELAKHGQKVRAIDRLEAHQAMIDHDLGYGTDPVREAINAGNFKADRGHNLLAAKITNERQANPDDPLSKVFSKDQIRTIHQGILYHDSSEVNFVIGDNSPEARKRNVESAIHLADNTHTFATKLPELLYVYPDTLKIMRLMKTAGEIGDQQAIGNLQTKLIAGIENNGDFAQDDKSALIHAAKSLSSESYRFTVGRICGDNPEFTIAQDGKLTISVAESAIHQEAVGIFDLESYDQLRKFIADLTGQEKRNVNMDSNSIVSKDGKLEIRLKIGEQEKSTGKTDYEQRVESLIQETSFQEFIIGGNGKAGDAGLSADQRLLQAELNNLPEDSDIRQQFTLRLEKIKQERKENLELYMQHLK